MTYSAKDLKVRTYVDGKVESEIKLDDPLNLNSKEKFSIGQAAWSGYMFRGWIDEFAVYNKALTEDQINNLSKNGTEVPASGVNNKPQSSITETDDSAKQQTANAVEEKINAAEIPGKTDKTKSESGTKSAGKIILITVLAVFVAGGISGVIIWRKKSGNRWRKC